MEKRNNTLWRLWGFLTFKTRWLGLRMGQILVPILLGLFVLFTKEVDYGGVWGVAIDYLAMLARFVIAFCFVEWLIRLPVQILKKLWLRLYKPLSAPYQKSNARKTFVVLLVLVLVPALAWQVNERWGWGLGLVSLAVLVTLFFIYFHETKGGKWKLNHVAWRLPVLQVSPNGEIVDREGRRFKIAILKAKPEIVSRLSVTPERRAGALLRFLVLLADFGTAVRIIRWQDAPKLNSKTTRDTQAGALYQSYMEMVQMQEGKVTLTALVYEAQEQVETELKAKLAEAGYHFWVLNSKEATAFMLSLTRNISFLQAYKLEEQVDFHPASLRFGQTILMDEALMDEAESPSALSIVLALAKEPEKLQTIEEIAFRCGGRLHMVLISEPCERTLFFQEGRSYAARLPGFTSKRTKEQEKEILAALLDKKNTQYLFTATLAIEITGEPKDCEQRVRQLCQALSSAHIVHKRLTEHALDDGLHTVMPVLPKAKPEAIIDSLDPLRLANGLLGAPLLEAQVLSSSIATSLSFVEGSKLALLEPGSMQIGVAREKGLAAALWLDLRRHLEAFLLVLGMTGSGKSTCLGEFILRSATGFDQFIIINLALQTKYWQELVKHLGGSVEILKPTRKVAEFSGKAKKALAGKRVILYEPLLGRPIANDPCLAHFLELVGEHITNQERKRKQGWILFAIDEAHYLTNPKGVEKVGATLQRARTALDDVIRHARRAKVRLLFGTHSVADLQGSIGELILQNFRNIALFRGAANEAQLQERLDYGPEVIQHILWLTSAESRNGDYVLVLADGRYKLLNLKLSKKELALSEVDDAARRGKIPEIGG